MLKVCGVTYDHTTNYGSCFQAYALQTAAESMKINGEPVSYSLLPLSLFSDYPGGSKSAVKKAYNAAYQSLHRKPFGEFEDRYMHFADCCSMDGLDRLNDEYDAFVCGSDVIWNARFNRGIGAYYLSFAKKYSFAYAPSFGKANEDVLKPEISGWIQKLDRISCRENNGVSIVEKITGSRPPVVADPVLLLDREQWIRIAETKRKIPEHFILSYNTYISPAYEEFLKKLSRQTGLPVVRTSWTLKNALRQGIIRVQDPQHWLKLMSRADYIVTNSFHATAFATIFHRRFFTVLRGEASKGFNVRMFDFLDNLGLKDRILTSVPDEINLNDVDYAKADERIKQIQENSMEYLRENLEAAYEQKDQRIGM